MGFNDNSKVQGDYAEKIAYDYLKTLYKTARMSEDPYDRVKDIEVETESGIWIPVEVKGTSIYVTRQVVALELSQLPKLQNAAENGLVLIITPEVRGYPSKFSGKICRLRRGFKHGTQIIHGRKRLVIPVTELEIDCDIPDHHLKNYNAIFNGEIVEIPEEQESSNVRVVDGIEIIKGLVPKMQKKIRWELLEIGESFFVEESSRTRRPNPNDVKKKFPDRKFVVRKEIKNNIRGWRIYRVSP